MSKLCGLGLVMLALFALPITLPMYLAKVAYAAWSNRR